MTPIIHLKINEWYLIYRNFKGRKVAVVGQFRGTETGEFLMFNVIGSDREWAFYYNEVKMFILNSDEFRRHVLMEVI